MHNPSNSASHASDVSDSSDSSDLSETSDLFEMGSKPHGGSMGGTPIGKGVLFVLALQMCMALWSGLDAIGRRWLSDDAFISFRYAKNWSEGHGLVYNIGESVEGFTNLVWTLWIGLGMSVGWEPEWFAHVSSLGFYFVMLGLLIQFHHRGLSIPLLLIAGMPHTRIFATSGLETQSFLTLIVVFIWAVKHRHWKILWIAMALAILTRPEGGLLWASVLPVLWFNNRKTLAVQTGSVGFLVLVGLEIWRWTTYGEWLPNTYYAKAQSAQWSQGLLYVWVFVQMYWFVPLGWFAGIVMLRNQKYRLTHTLWIQFTLVFASLYAIHVIRVGGDFMMARFALPWAIPLVIVLGTWIQERALSTSMQFAVALLVSGVSLTVIPPSGLTDIQDGQIGIQGITEESFWYTEEWRQKAERAGKEIKPMLQETPIKVAIYGAQAMFAYYAELPYALEGMTGLTDKELARMPSREARVGHGRKATVPYLQSRGVDLYIDFRLNQGAHPLNQIHLGSLSGSILSYKKEHMSLLRERGAEFQDFEEYLDWYIDTLAIKSDAEKERDMQIFKYYYFQFNDEPIDQKRWRRLTTP